MNEIGMLFNDYMVRAILDGSKNQTRRIVKNITGIGVVTEFGASDIKGYDWTFRDGRMLWNDLQHNDLLKRCPYGQTGAKLWVREAWTEVPFPAPGPKCQMIGHRGISYRSDWNGNPSGYLWRPSIHMPRWACRLILEITDIHVERVKEITEEDALAEGLSNGDQFECARDEFLAIWDSLYAKQGLGPTANPWVWVITFKALGR